MSDFGLPETAPMRGVTATPQCSTCGVVLQQGQVLYGRDGSILCRTCDMQGDVEHAKQGAADSLGKQAWGVLGGALASFFFNPFLIVSIGAITGALAVLKRLNTDEDDRKRLGNRVGKLQAVATVGLIVAALRILLVFVPR